MCAKSKVLWLALLPALLFMTTTGWVLSEAAAAIVISCNESTCGCKNKESCDKMKKGDYCKEGTISCDDKGTECGCTAARVVAPPTKVQPKVQPGSAETPKVTPKVVPKATIGGAEQPEEESDTIPTMRPKGGVKQY
jgi:hypothetical protein